MNSSFDIIGDIHGHFGALKMLLVKLGYHQDGGHHFFHPAGRKAVFIGDFVDRGPDIPGVLRTVKSMMDSGEAAGVMGNHEYNCLAFHTPKDPGIFGQSQGDHSYLRPHTDPNLKQARATLSFFEKHPDEQKEYLEWMMGLPLFLEWEGIRVIHACWNHEKIAFAKEHLPGFERLGGRGCVLTPEFLQKSAINDSDEFLLVETLLKGPESPLPGGILMRGFDESLRKEYRVKWWLTSSQMRNAQSLAELGMLSVNAGRPDVSAEWFARERDQLSAGPEYGNGEKPVIFGHYWFEGEPVILQKNAACVDYSIARRGRLTAYAWDGEKELDPGRFIWV